MGIEEQGTFAPSSIHSLKLDYLDNRQEKKKKHLLPVNCSCRTKYRYMQCQSTTDCDSEVTQTITL